MLKAQGSQTDVFQCFPYYVFSFFPLQQLRTVLRGYLSCFEDWRVEGNLLLLVCRPHCFWLASMWLGWSSFFFFPFLFSFLSSHCHSYYHTTPTAAVFNRSTAVFDVEPFVFEYLTTKPLNEFRSHLFLPHGVAIIRTQLSTGQNHNSHIPGWQLCSPDPILLETHYLIAKMINASGRGEIVKEIQGDYDGIHTLAKDGTTVVSRLLSITILGSSQLVVLERTSWWMARVRGTRVVRVELDSGKAR